jgi:cellulose synthase/poly-beta-1,6-N-acetylglucosamine synthase-like glycosyltransferase
VGEFSAQGVELIRLPKRAGKTAAENAATAHLRGDIVVNIDATARPAHDALKALVGVFADQTVGVASARDVSTGSSGEETNSGESGYVSYEMRVRALETRLGSIVGASGCCYAIRRELYEAQFPEALSRDFASALIALEHGQRAVSVDDAVCAVPRAHSLDHEFRRKVRTMHRGLETLWFKRQLLNPVRYGRYALMLFSHKLCRWLVSLTLPGAIIGLGILGATWAVGAWMLGAAVAILVASAIALRRPHASGVLRRLALPSYVLMASAAGVVAWWEAFRKERQPIWEPTRRPV